MRGKLLVTLAVIAFIIGEVTAYPRRHFHPRRNFNPGRNFNPRRISTPRSINYLKRKISWKNIGRGIDKVGTVLQSAESGFNIARMLRQPPNEMPYPHASMEPYFYPVYTPEYS